MSTRGFIPDAKVVRGVKMTIHIYFVMRFMTAAIPPFALSGN
jgi:hypothetical protein